MARRPGSRRRGRGFGFTLLELLVVFAILALLLGLAPVAFERMRDSSAYRDAVRTMMSQMRSARYAAVSEGREVRFVVDLQQRGYGIEGGKTHRLPDTLELRATVAGTDIAQGEAAIRFLPGGGATGGSVEVLRPGGAGTRLRVDWLSGRVSQEALLP